VEYDYNVIIPVKVKADTKLAAEEIIINNLAKYVMENKERITLEYVEEHTSNKD